jgi:hypothetical protein
MTRLLRLRRRLAAGMRALQGDARRVGAVASPAIRPTGGGSRPRSRPNRWLLTVAATLMLTVGGVAGIRMPAAAAGGCAPNPVVCENTLPGTLASEWDIHGAGDSTIQGFASDISVNVGQRIDFKIATVATAYTIDIYRIGWYGGTGARKVDSVQPSVPMVRNDPATCVTDLDLGLFDCGGWAVSASWAVPTTAVSGAYVATLKRTDTGGKSQITFVVRDDSSTSNMVFKTADATWQAYNSYGINANFYHGGNNGRAYKISYNRPFATRDANGGRDFFFSNEFPMIRFLERNGYDVSYITDVDADRAGGLIKNHKLFMSVGHDEYWSGPERANVEAARDAGVNLAFFSGNEVYWKTRWEPSVDGTSTPNRTLVSYKETWANAKIDPSSEWTGTWRDPRFSPPSNGGKPENALTGTAYMTNSIDLPIQVPADEGQLRFWRNTGIANLAPGTVATLADHTLGYESDEDLDNGFRPGGLIHLSTTVGAAPQYLQDFGTTVAAGTTTHHLTLYRAASGALVFSAGTIQWAWGLDNDHDGTEPPVDQRMQQATVNLFADMGVQPATLMTGLTAATASGDIQAPTVTITAPAAGTTVTNGSQVTVQGTAADVGGRVAAVEVSTDGGTTWHRADGTTAWSYSFFASGMTTQTVLVRGVDDSVNIQSTPASVQLSLSGPSSLFGQKSPANPAVSDTSAVELGVKVTPQSAGYITGVRFYKGTANTGTHTGSLWSAGGTRLATGTFAGETSSGWQTLVFPSPVAVTAGTTYVASYFAPSGHYAADPWSFAYSGVISGPLRSPRSQDVGGNGVYRAGTGFPASTYQATNYYVDVLFVDGTIAAPTVVSTSPAANAQYVPVTAKPSALFSKALDPTTIQFRLTDSAGVAVAGATSYDAAAKSVTFTPSAALVTSRAYTATVQARDTTGNPMSAPATWSFTTDEYASVSTLFAPDAMPQRAAVTDASAVALGVKFTPSVNGSLVGVRFYQGPGNTGVHTGSLWSATGTLLARATFSGETGSGWQTVHFATPVAVTAGTPYVASYYAPNGHYASDANFFATAWSNGSPTTMTAPAGANGVYIYGSDAFPTNSYQSGNYWVDPILLPGSAPSPTPTPSPAPSPAPSPSACPPVAPAPVPAGTSTIFADTDTPAVANWNDPTAVEVGMKFTTDVTGLVTGVRFYKGSLNTGTHTGSLWSSTGQQLATATFQGETCAGWQTVTFSQPVRINPGTTYLVSYSTTVGYYAVTNNQFASVGINKAPFRVPTSGGAYRYGGGFPNSASKHNYWVDVMFQAG